MKFTFEDSYIAKMWWKLITFIFVTSLKHMYNQSRSLFKGFAKGKKVDNFQISKITCIIHAFDESGFFLHKSKEPTLNNIKKTLWKLRFQLLKLQTYADAEQTKNLELALNSLYSIYAYPDPEAKPMLERIINNRETSDVTKKLARRVLNEINRRFIC